MVINPDTIEFDSLKSLESFIYYRQDLKIGADSGFILAGDLLNQKGGILYPKGTNLDKDRIPPLKRLSENNPDWELSLSVQKNEKLAKTLKVRLLEQFKRVIKTRKARKEYGRLFEKIEKMLDKYQDEIFKQPDFIYTLYHAWYTETTNSKDGRTPYFFHQLSSALFSLGVIYQAHQILNMKFINEDYVKVIQIALLRNIAGIEGVAFVKKKKAEDLKKMYIQSNGNSAVVASRLMMPQEVCDAVRICSEYDNGRREMVKKEDSTSVYANIVITADNFDLRITGLFDGVKNAQDSLDKMYIAAQAGDFVKSYIDALAKGFNFSQLFDFYYEIERLNNACKFGPGKLGRSYPMTGFKSPVIYVCKGNMSKCPHFSASTKAVTIFKKVGDLEEGSYGRCELLSDQLIKFYDEFYKEIKEETRSKASS